MFYADENEMKSVSPFLASLFHFHCAATNSMQVGGCCDNLFKKKKAFVDFKMDLWTEPLDINSVCERIKKKTNANARVSSLFIFSCLSICLVVKGQPNGKNNHTRFK